MSESPMVGARVEKEWVEQINSIAQALGCKPAEIVREALAQYLAKTDPSSVKGVVADLQDKPVTVGAIPSTGCVSVRSLG